MASRNQYVSLEIGGQLADMDPSGQIPTVDYALEDEQNFEEKQSATSFDIEMPATLINDQIHNTLHNPSVVDNTADQSNDNYKPAKYIANGQEILIGQYLPQSVGKQFGRPTKYKGKIYGLNGDWVILLKDKTLLDFVNPRNHVFSDATVIGSWNFDGTVEAADYVYAPVRYLSPFGDVPPASDDPDAPTVADDTNAVLNNMKPSISIYWILWRGFKSAGYKIISTFMDLPYYRRGVMPWTWGGFDFLDDTRWQGLKFLAAQYAPPDGSVTPGPGYGRFALFVGDITDYPDLSVVTDDSLIAGSFENTPGLFTYTPDASPLKHMMMWTYPATGPLVLGTVIANFSVDINWAYNVVNNSDAEIRVRWYKNGVMLQDDVILMTTAPLLGSRGQINVPDFREIFFQTEISPGDYVGARIYLHLNVDTGLGGGALAVINIQGFQLNFLKLGPGSTVNLQNYPKFKDYNWLDLLRGEVDMFDLSIQTDPIKKEVYIEPTHSYVIDGTKYPGYFNRLQLEWSAKVDSNKESELELFSDYNREYDFSFKNDDQDGGLKIVQDRNLATVGLAKYILPQRFQTDIEAKENRFFAPCMHYNHDAWKLITGLSPQLIAIIPENISNTSAPESENVYEPKRAYYKGNVTGAGGWSYALVKYSKLPFLFSVNYQPGGQLDPVFSYGDQMISGIIGRGLLHTFFLQRMCIYRNGRRYNQIFMMLNNNDVTNFLHRESVIIDEMEFLITAITGYNPVEPDSTGVTMWMFSPVTERDRDAVYPSPAALETGNPLPNTFDFKYWPHILLITDIPNYHVTS